MSGSPVEREAVPGLATLTAIFKAGSAGAPAVSVSVISRVRAVVAAVSQAEVQAQDEGADGGAKGGRSERTTKVP